MNSMEADRLNRRHQAVVLDTLMCNLSIAVVVVFFVWMVPQCFLLPASEFSELQIMYLVGEWLFN